MPAFLKANLLATALGILAAIFLIIAIIQTIQIHGFLWVDGLNDKLADCARDRNELRAIAKAKDEQRAETSKRIEQADKGNREADKVAREIEEAPLPGDCRTPDEVMRADV
jgi:hypothetical protein